MTFVEKVLIIGSIDEFLLGHMDSEDQFTEEERQIIEDRLCEVLDTNSPRALRESLKELARKLYDEIKEASE